MKRKTGYRLWLWSETKNDYAPTLHPLQNTALDAQKYARKNLRLEENLTGRKAFEVRGEFV